LYHRGDGHDIHVRDHAYDSCGYEDGGNVLGRLARLVKVLQKDEEGVLADAVVVKDWRIRADETSILAAWAALRDDDGIWHTLDGARTRSHLLEDAADELRNVDFLARPGTIFEGGFVGRRSTSSNSYSVHTSIFLILMYKTYAMAIPKY
jgi:hypothetical protein